MPWQSTQMTGSSFRGSKSVVVPAELTYSTRFICCLIMCTTFPCSLFTSLTLVLLLGQLVSSRYQRFSTTYTPHSSERQRERQRGLVKQTFELDEAAAAERQDDQVADGDVILNTQ